MDTCVQLLSQWGYVGMFLSALLAGSVLPFSSEAVMVACIGFGMDPMLTAVSGTAGNVLGGLTCFWIGHLGKMEWIEKVFKVKREQLDRATRFVQGRGSWMAFFGFLPLLGSAILIVLGLMRARTLPVTFFMALGKALRYFVLVAATMGVIHAL